MLDLIVGQDVGSGSDQFLIIAYRFTSSDRLIRDNFIIKFQDSTSHYFNN